MKKIRIIVAIVVLVLMLAFGMWFVFSEGNDIEPKPTIPVPTEPIPTSLEPFPTGEPSPVVVHSPETSIEVSPTVETGMIDGEVLLKGVEVSRILTEPFIDVLGEPMEVQGHWIYYDGLQILATWDDAVENQNMVRQLWGLESGLSMFEINGISFDNMTRADLVAAFGMPLVYFEYPGWKFEASAEDLFIKYHVLGGGRIDYILNFDFEPEFEGYVSGIGIIKTDWGA